MDVVDGGGAWTKTETEDEPKSYEIPSEPALEDEHSDTWHLTDLFYGPLKSETVGRISVAAVTDPKTVDKRVPRRNSTNDRRGGPTERGGLCGSCRQGSECGGHSLHIDLAIPTYSPLLMEEIVRVLSCICPFCMRLRISKSHPKFEAIQRMTQRRTRLQAMYSICGQIRTCADCALPDDRRRTKTERPDEEPKETEKEKWCGEWLPRFFRSGTAIGAEFVAPLTASRNKAKAFPKFNAYRIYQILDAISDEDAGYLGCDTAMGHPRDWIIHKLCVIAPTARPSIAKNEASRKRGDDELTGRYNAVVKFNIKLANLLKSELGVKDLSKDLFSQYRICRWLLNDGSTVACTCADTTCSCITAGTVAAPVSTAKRKAPTVGPLAAVAMHLDEDDDGGGKTGKVGTAQSRACDSLILAMADKMPKAQRDALELINDIQATLFQLMTGETKSSVIKSKDAKFKIIGGPGAQSYCIKQRLVGKSGRVRGNVMGKRQDYSGRTVVTGRDDWPMNCLGVPFVIYSTCTIPERVNKYNHAFLTNLVRKHEVNFIIAPDGTRYTRKFIDNASFILQEGMVVERWLQDDDVVFFGRQPSLHGPSLMAVAVKRLPKNISCFIAHMSLTTPYNYDCDGDEMNVEIPRSEKARAEARLLMDPARHTKSCQGPRVLMGVNQHAMLAAYLASKPDTFLPWANFSQCLYHFTVPGSGFLTDMTPDRANRNRFEVEIERLKKIFADPTSYAPPPAVSVRVCNVCKSATKLAFSQENGGRWTCGCCSFQVVDRVWLNLWTGRQLFDTVSPRLLFVGSALDKSNVSLLSSPSTPDSAAAAPSVLDGEWLVHDGDLVVGTLDKKRYHTYLHAFVQDYGEDLYSRYLTGVTRMWHHFMDGHGCTFSPRDYQNPCAEETNKILDNAVAWVDKQTDYNISTCNQKEQQIHDVLEKARELVSQKVIQGMKQQSEGKGVWRTNGLLDIVESGAKGSAVNISQIVGSFGTNKVGNKRIAGGGPHGVNAPHSAEIHGFVKNAFGGKGLTEIEHINHARSAREGIVETGTKTSKIGYFFRRISKNYDSIHVATDGTVRDANGDIYQWAFGGDHYHPKHLEDVPLRLVRVGSLSKREFTPTDSLLLDEAAQARLNEQGLELVEQQEKLVAFIQKKLSRRLGSAVAKAFDGGESGDVRISCPVPFPRLLKSMTPPPSVLQTKKSDLTPSECWSILTKCWKELIQDGVAPRSQWSLNEKEQEEQEEESAGSLMELLFLDWMSPAQLIRDVRVTKSELLEMCDRIRTFVARARMEYGDNVGILTAHQIAEPGMQMSMRVFHVAGRNQAAANGFGPLDALMSLKKHAAAYMTIGVAEPWSSKPVLVEFLADALVETPLKSILLARGTECRRCSSTDPVADRVKAKMADYWAALKPAPKANAAAAASLSDTWALRFALDPKRVSGPCAQTSVGLVASSICRRLYRENKESLFFGHLEWDYDIMRAMSSNSDEPMIVEIRLSQAHPQLQKLTEQFSKNLRRISDPLDVVEPAAAAATASAPTAASLAAAAVAASAASVAYTTVAASPAPTGKSATKHKAAPIALTQDQWAACMHALMTLLKEEVTVSGIAGIKHAQATAHRTIRTEGSNMVGVARYPIFDINSTVTDSLPEAERLIGVETGSLVVERRVTQIMSDSGCGIDRRYSRLNADVMSRSGSLIPMTASGAMQRAFGITRLLSFEKLIETLRTRAAFGVGDPLLGVTERVMTTGLAPIGTGLVFTRTPTSKIPTTITDGKRKRLPPPKTVEQLKARVVRPKCESVAFYRQFVPSADMMRPASATWPSTTRTATVAPKPAAAFDFSSAFDE